jgi:hypothetical protein
MKNLITICLLLATAFTSQAQEEKKVEDCDCPKPTRDEFTGVCNAIYEKKGDGEGFFGDKYQELMWKISCADPKKDSKEVAYQKIRCMWNKYRVEFRCFGYTGVSAADTNVANFSIDTGFSTFLVAAVKRWKLDMNFIDPADGETLMDFLLMRRESYKNNYTAKYEEYDRIYKLLEKNGAKHAKDL